MTSWAYESGEVLYCLIWSFPYPAYSRTARSCFAIVDSCAAMEEEMADLTESGRLNARGVILGSAEAARGVDEPRSILPWSRERRSQSFRREVGVPSMHECSPLKPDLPFSKTTTVQTTHQPPFLVRGKENATHAGACRTTGPSHPQPKVPSYVPPSYKGCLNPARR